MDSGTAQKVGIVTVTYNSAGVLADFFDSLWKQTHSNFVLYAVDNASKDATLDRLKAEADQRLIIHASSVNLGIAEGNNIGIRMALQDGCDSVLLLNNDVVFASDLIEILVKSQRVQGSDMIAPKMLYYGPANTIWWAGGYFQVALGYRAVHTGLDQIDKGQCDRPMRAVYAPTCCVLVNRDVFTRIGMMDAKYFVYFDDADFMLRAHKAGIFLYYEPAAVLRHKVGSLSGSLPGAASPFIVHLLARNRVYFWLKHTGRLMCWFYTASLSAVYMIQYLFCLKRGPTLKIQLKGMMDGLKLA